METAKDKIKRILDQKKSKTDLMGEPLKKTEKPKIQEEDQVISQQITDLRDPGVAALNLITSIQKSQDILIDLGKVLKDRLDKMISLLEDVESSTNEEDAEKEEAPRE